MASADWASAEGGRLREGALGWLGVMEDFRREGVGREPVPPREEEERGVVGGRIILALTTLLFGRG